MAGWVDPDHKAGWFPFLGAGLDLVDAGLWDIHWVVLEESRELPNVLDRLNCHTLSPVPKNHKPDFVRLSFALLNQ